MLPKFVHRATEAKASAKVNPKQKRWELGNTA